MSNTSTTITEFNAKYLNFQAQYLTPNTPAYTTIKKVMFDDEKKINHFIATISNTLVQQPELIETCEPTSLIKACLKCAELGLSTSNGEANLVPFRYGNVKSVNFIIGYKGFIRLASRVGISMNCHLVYKGEKFNRSYILKYGQHDIKDDIEVMDFRPFIDTGKVDQRGKPVYSFYYQIVKDTISFGYCYLLYNNGRKEVEAMRVSEIVKRVKASKTFGKNVFYVDWFEEMMKKTIVKYVLKMRIFGVDDTNFNTTQISQAIDLDNEAEAGKSQAYTIGDEIKEAEGEIIESGLDLNQEAGEKLNVVNVESSPVDPDRISESELKGLHAHLNNFMVKNNAGTEAKVTIEDIKANIKECYKVESTKQLTKKQVKEITQVYV